MRPASPSLQTAAEHGPPAPSSLLPGPRPALQSPAAVWVVVAVSALGYFVDILDLFLFNVFRIPSLASLGVPADQLLPVGARIINVQMVGLLLGSFVWGVLGDRRGPHDAPVEAQVAVAVGGSPAALEITDPDLPRRHAKLGGPRCNARLHKLGSAGFVPADQRIAALLCGLGRRGALRWRQGQIAVKKADFSVGARAL